MVQNLQIGLQSAVIPGNYRKMFLNGVETFPGALGCCLAAKMTEINCLTGWLLGNLMKIFQNLTARGWFWGYPTPRKSDLRKKTPDLAFLGSSLTILKF